MCAPKVPPTTAPGGRLSGSGLTCDAGRASEGGRTGAREGLSCGHGVPSVRVAAPIKRGGCVILGTHLERDRMHGRQDDVGFASVHLGVVDVVRCLEADAAEHRPHREAVHVLEVLSQQRSRTPRKQRVQCTESQRLNIRLCAGRIELQALTA
eukprot:3089804-Prymnesium_polylepis.1